MRHIFSLITALIVLSACGQNRSTRLTVIFSDDQNPNSKVTVDTLLKAKQINVVDTPIDLSFACMNFHLPYYVPTEGIYKNAAKDQECDMKIYPRNVKCYEYDDKNRVTKMTVNGSGTMNNFKYLYNDKNQVTEITDVGSKFELKYNADGTLSELKQTSPFNKKLVFVYE
jgi:YD repeat-containing protein